MMTAVILLSHVHRQFHSALHRWQKLMRLIRPHNLKKKPTSRHHLNPQKMLRTH